MWLLVSDVELNQKSVDTGETIWHTMGLRGQTEVVNSKEMEPRNDIVKSTEMSFYCAICLPNLLIPTKM